jgi:hypothetical protein
MVIHKCNKEGEIATMAEKINYIEKKVDSIETKLDKFISTADNKYATKSELQSLKDSRKETAEWLQWVPTLISALIAIILLFRGI